MRESGAFDATSRLGYAIPMHLRWIAPLSFVGSFACSDSEQAGSTESSESARGGSEMIGAIDTLRPLPGSPSTDSADDATSDEAEPAAAPGGSAATEATPFAVFMDAATGFMTDAVHDADREVVRFETAVGAMVSGASGDAVNGWSVTGSDLRWSRSGVPFRVRFGTEAGERRAYFTEAGPGTICNLSLVGPDVLSISATSETPPNP